MLAAICARTPASTPVALASAAAVAGLRLKGVEHGIAAQTGPIERGNLGRELKDGLAYELEPSAGDPAAGQHLEGVDQTESGGTESADRSDEGGETAQGRSRLRFHDSS